ncbi:MAG: GNAT family N-acetyltransferase [Armatimonadota bacterium]|nr:GNAT family N-acetyltransferase [Armatimonadota bacterium]
MQLVVRPATADDGATLVRVLEAAYGGGYSPTFDRDGALQPNDLWWVQSEKDVGVVEVNKRPAGVLVVGRRGGQWLVEELLLPAFGEFPARAQDALVERMTALVAGLFQRGRQTALLVRAAETNAFGLTLAHRLGAALANALVVYRYRGNKRPAAHPPEGYQMRRTTSADARAVGRLARETLAERARADEIERVLAGRDGRGYVALKDEVVVGFSIVETRAGRGDWTLGVRDSHRRKGVGRALAAAALASLHAREYPPYATVWALDAVGGPFLRSLGFQVERTFLYLERPL